LKGKLTALADTYLSLHAEEGCLDVLSDHGILPSYAFPIYVDELRLNEYTLREPPRVDLKLQRDRAIALREYSPGRTFIAGKSQILSRGLWQGYEVKTFTFCPRCSAMDFNSNAGTICSSCKAPLSNKKALIPRAGFFGKVIRNVKESVDQTPVEFTDVYFDPAEDPPPQHKPLGRGLTIALLDARQMRRSRMRMLNPRPRHEGILMIPRSVTDAALPHSPAVGLFGASARRTRREIPFNA
jgi:hypothetical protein